MDREDLFWLRVWHSLVVLGAVGILTTGTCTMHRNQLITQSILEGNDPMRVGCAYGVGNQQTNCLAQALK